MAIQKPKSVKSNSGTSDHFAAAGGLGLGPNSGEEGTRMNPIDPEARGNSYYNCTFQYGSMYNPTPQPNVPHNPTTYHHPVQRLLTDHYHPTTTYRHTIETTAVTSNPNFDIIPDHILATIPLPGLSPQTNQTRRSKKTPPKNPYKKRPSD